MCGLIVSAPIGGQSGRLITVNGKTTSIGNYQPRYAERPAACSHTSMFNGHVTQRDQLNHEGWAETPRT
jgi:hypothetical protein